ANQVTLPRLGQGMESGTIVRWLKAEGDKVEKGEPLYELDTEKVTQEVEADASGVVLKILAGEGEEIEVGKPVAVIGEEGEDISSESDDSAEKEPSDGDGSAPEPAEDEDGAAREVAEDEPKEEGDPAPEREDERERGREARADSDGKPAEETEPVVTQEASRRVKASPLARRLAKERGLELSSLEGTGPEGRIVAEDVERAAAQPGWAAEAPASAEVEVVQLSSMRKTIARRMTEAWETPHFQIAMTADMRAAMRLRELLVERAPEGAARPTFSDVLTKACAIALMRHRDMNAHFAGTEVHIFPTANIGIAVAVPHGLVVPVIRNSERKSIADLAAARADLVERTRGGKLTQADLEDGTFTISNLGMYGVDRFVAVLNPPQAGILAVGAIQERPVVGEGGELVGRPVMELTLSCDHRSVDGATASEFLGTVKTFLEEPSLML
ncbi:MAG TPA: dihydrolipoamide acetyltransferase family protein, partial [Gaiellaceae bacterium]|nr:dihydrolipoamide acetyltransferase family protein [Gaiellaceae bacterium]